MTEDCDTKLFLTNTFTVSYLDQYDHMEIFVTQQFFAKGKKKERSIFSLDFLLFQRNSSNCISEVQSASKCCELHSRYSTASTLFTNVLLSHVYCIILIAIFLFQQIWTHLKVRKKIEKEMEFSQNTRCPKI